MTQAKIALFIIILFYSVIFAESTWTSPFHKSAPDENFNTPLLETGKIELVTERPIKILVTRPVTKFGNAPIENRWVLLLCEHFLNFRQGGIEAISVIDRETLIEEIPDLLVSRNIHFLSFLNLLMTEYFPFLIYRLPWLLLSVS